MRLPIVVSRELTTRRPDGRPPGFAPGTFGSLSRHALLFQSLGCFTRVIRPIYHFSEPYQSHLYKIRVKDLTVLTPYLLIAALSSEFVQRQIKSFCVSQDIIDSLGGKIRELRIPIPKSPEKREQINKIVERVINDRMEARELARKACDDIIAGE
jgi:hypothetical protein